MIRRDKNARDEDRTGKHGGTQSGQERVVCDVCVSGTSRVVSEVGTLINKGGGKNKEEQRKEKKRTAKHKEPRLLTELNRGLWQRGELPPHIYPESSQHCISITLSAPSSFPTKLCPY